MAGAIEAPEWQAAADSPDEQPSTQRLTPEDLLGLICTSGRPFSLMEVRVVTEGSSVRDDKEEEEKEKEKEMEEEEKQRPEDVEGGSQVASQVPEATDIQPGSGAVGEVWCRGPTVFSGKKRWFSCSHECDG